MSAWQTIETAPKDRWILLRGGELNEQSWSNPPGHPAVVARWSENNGWQPLEGWFVADFDDGYGLGVYYYAPTEWAEIPN